MKKKIHIIFFACLLIFFNTNLKAEEKLCLDEEGLYIRYLEMIIALIIVKKLIKKNLHT